MTTTTPTTPTTIIIFGASGDLTRRKLIPALFQLCRQNRLPGSLRIVGLAPSEWNTAEFHQQMRGGVDEFAREAFSEGEWAAFAERLHYTPGSFTDPAAFAQLRQCLAELEGGDSHRLLPRYPASFLCRDYRPIGGGRDGPGAAP